MEPEKSADPLWDLTYILTQDEIYRCAKAGDIRRIGKTGTVVETVILGVMAVYCLSAFFLDGMGEGMPLFLGVASLALIAAIWAVPELRYRRAAVSQAQNRSPNRVRVFHQGFAFGADDTLFLFGSEDVILTQNMWVLRYGAQLFPLPFRALPEDCRKFLQEKTGFTPSGKDPRHSHIKG